jgi:hypothetical protein
MYIWDEQGNICEVADGKEREEGASAARQAVVSNIEYALVKQREAKQRIWN